jgi:hypothetical protein
MLIIADTSLVGTLNVDMFFYFFSLNNNYINKLLGYSSNQ